MSSQKPAESTVSFDKEKFEAKLDLRFFSSSEISVKFVKNLITVKAEHDEKENQCGFIYVSFIKKYPLSEWFDMSKGKKKFGKDGILTITVPRTDSGSQDFWTKIEVTKKSFEATMNHIHFGPDEISSDLVDGLVTVVAQHWEKEVEFGCICRDFVRKLVVPVGFDLSKVVALRQNFFTIIVDRIEPKTYFVESSVQYDKDKFKAKLDFQKLGPMEVSAWITDHNEVVVKAIYGEKEDELGCMYRSFKRRYLLPGEIKIKNLQHNLNQDRIYLITGRRMNPREDLWMTADLDQEKFQARLNLKDFQWEGVQVNLSERTLTVEAKHGDKKDEFGYISRHLVRKFMFSEDLDVSRLSYYFGNDGVLTIIVPNTRTGRGFVESTSFPEENFFKVSFKIGCFKKGEVTVNVVEDTLIVEGKHEEREEDYGLTSRHFVWKYVRPKEIDFRKRKVEFCDDGTMVVSAPKLGKNSNDGFFYVFSDEETV